MWNYEKRLQYPVNISQKNPAMAQVIITQLGGPDGELAASMRYISQRYVMPYREVAGPTWRSSPPSCISSRKACPRRN